MSTISNSASDCTFSTTGLPDELSPAAQAQFVEECNAFDDERRAQEAGNTSDYFELIARIRRQNDELAALTARANAERDRLDVEIKAHCAAMKRISNRITAALA
ncbi:MAG TPA: hypothetical protein VGG19_20700 [Tepidisphaeraceae bacterium]|jgi:hypothetical protein